MRRGRGRQLGAMVIGGVLLLATGVVFLRQVSHGDGYADATAAVTRIERDNFQAYFACALPGTRTEGLNAERVQAALLRAAARQGKNYVATLSRCAPYVHALSERVGELEMPTKVGLELQALIAAASALATANDQYVTYLSQGPEPYDPRLVEPMIDRLRAGCAEYPVAHERLLSSLRKHA